MVNSIPGNDLPSSGAQSIDWFVRQAGHVLLHVILTFFAWMVAKGSWKSMRAWVFTTMFAVSYSLLDELYQGLIPGRNPNWGDVGYNLAGVFLAAGWIAYRHRRDLFYARRSDLVLNRAA